MLQLDYSYYLNAYARQEKQFFDISQHITINNSQLNVYSAELADHIVNSVSLIEGVSNDLYAKICRNIKNIKNTEERKELIRFLSDRGFPYSENISNKDREAFETKSLRALEVLWQLSHKQLYINASSIHLTQEYVITPFKYAYLTQKEINILRKESNDSSISRPLWSEAYRSNKHNRLDSLKPYFDINNQIEIASDAVFKFNEIIEGMRFCVDQEKTFFTNAKKEAEKSKEPIEDLDKPSYDAVINKINVLKDNITSLEEMVSNMDRETKPTVKAALEALGALYILCIYARYIQDDVPTSSDAPEICNLIDFGSCMESKLFIADPYEAVIDNPCLPQSNNSLKDFHNLSKSLFVQKDQEVFLKQVLSLEINSINQNTNNNNNSNGNGNGNGGNSDGVFNNSFILGTDNNQYSIIPQIPFNFHFDEYKTLSKSKAATTLMLLGYPRKIVLNTYCHTIIHTIKEHGQITKVSIDSVYDNIYDYNNINQTKSIDEMFADKPSTDLL